MHVRFLHLPLLFLTLFFVTSAIAQEDVLVLTWDKAWELAQEKNESYATARDELVRADEQVGEAWSAALPTVTATGAFQHYFEIPKSVMVLPAEMNIDPTTGQSLGPLRLKIQQGMENIATTSVELNQTLWAGGKVGLGLKAAKEYRNLSELSVDVAREDLRVSLTEAFYATVLAEEALEVTLESFEQSKAYFEQVKSMNDQGMVSEYDLIRSEVMVANMRPQVTAAATNVDLSYKALKNLLGINLNKEVVVEGELEDSGELLLAYDDAVQLATSQRVEFRQLDHSINLYKIQEKVYNRSWLWPNFFAQLSWSTTAQSEDMNFPKYEFLGGYGALVGVSIPLFDGLSSYHKAQQAKVDVRNTMRQRSQLERGVQLQVYAAQREYEKAQEQLKAALDARNLAERGYDIAQVRYKEGVGTQLEVLDAHQALSGSKANVLNAKYNLRVARAEFDRATGRHFSVSDTE